MTTSIEASMLNVMIFLFPSNKNTPRRLLAKTNATAAVCLWAFAALFSGCEGTADLSSLGREFPSPSTVEGGASNGGGVTSMDAGSTTDAGSGATTTTLNFEDRVVQLVNERRAAGATCGGTPRAPVPPLVHNEALRLIARAHSIDMATRNFFDHRNPEGKSPFDRMDEAGYNRPQPWGENIAAGQTTPEEAMRSWMNSPGHCNNIMSSGFSHIGVGYDERAGSSLGHYWTQAFSN